MKTVKVQFAKTHLSALLAEVEAGTSVRISRGAVPVAMLEPISADASPRPLGFLNLEIPESFFEPLSEEDLAAWEGE